MAFKIVDDEFGQLTYTRIYQGTIKKGESYYNQRTGKKERFSRIVRMHADKREEIDSAERRRHRRRHGHRLRHRRYLLLRAEATCSLRKHVRAEPVIKMSIKPLIARQRRQARQGPAALPQGRPHVPRHDRRRDQRNGHRRHGRVAPGNLRRTDPPRIQRGRRSRRPEGELPRGGHRKRTPSTTSARSKPAVPASTATSWARWAR